jgi:hypothetical protein
MIVGLFASGGGAPLPNRKRTNGKARSPQRPRNGRALYPNDPLFTASTTVCARRGHTTTVLHLANQAVFGSIDADRRFHIAAPRIPKPATIISQVLGSGTAADTENAVMAPAVESVPLAAPPSLMLTTL